MIYTAAQVQGAARQAPAFTTRNIAGLTTSEMSGLDLVAVPHAKQLAYDGYKSNISAFMAATAKGEKRSCQSIGHGFTIPFNQILLPEPVPPIAFVSKMNMSEPSRQAFLERYAANRVTWEAIDEKSKTMIFIMRSPTHEVIREIVRNVAEPNRVPSGVTTIEGYRAWITCWKLITVFISTQTYPAFLHDNAGRPYEHDSEVCIVSPSVTASSKKRRAEPFETLGPIRKKDERKAGWVAPNTEEVEDGVYREIFDFDQVSLQMALRDAVLVAKPAPFRPSINFGPPASVPNMPGILFPYFEGLLRPDYTTIHHTVGQYFLGSFGDTKDIIEQNYRQWRRTHKTMTRTPAGMILIHVMKMVELALEAQARLFVIVDHGRYLGSCLLGARFSVIKTGEMYGVSEPDMLHNELSSLTSHDSALEELRLKLSTMELVDGEMSAVAEVPPEAISTARGLVEQMRMRMKPTEEDDIKDFKRLLSTLSFPQPFRPMGIDGILLALSYERDGVVPINEPLWLEFGLIYREDVTAYFILGMFGSSAPSFVNAAGVRFEIPSSKASDQASVVDEKTGKQRMPSILVGYKATSAAVVDFERVRKESAVFQNLQERAAPHRNVRYDGAARNRIWEALIETFGMSAANLAKVAKRVADDQLNREKNPKKAKVTDDAGVWETDLF